MPTLAEMNMKLGDTFDNIRADMRDLFNQVVALKIENESIKNENKLLEKQIVELQKSIIISSITKKEY